ncbi:MAG: hypothetical protein ACRDRS_10975 [Pseudonocardiaceae bacterium]
MTIAVVNEPEWARWDTTLSARPAAPTPTTRERREWSVADYRTVLRWPVDEDAGGFGLRLGCGAGAAVSGVAMIGARLRMTGPGTLALPPSVTTRWVVAPESGLATLPRLHAVLSAAWQTAGCGR